MTIFFALVAALLALAVMQVWLWSPMLIAGLLLALPLMVTAALQRPGNVRRQIAAAVVTVPYFVIGAMEWMVEGSTVAGLQVATCIAVQLLLMADSVRRRARRAPEE